MADELTIEGLQELTRLFREMETNSGRRIVKAALRAAVNEVGKEFRRKLSPRVKQARKGIRHIVKGSKRVTAKVGVHVGKGRNKQPRHGPSAPNRGIGIGARNVHWWINGSSTRRRKDGTYTGAMTAQQPGLAANAFRTVSGRLPALMQQRADRQLQKEIARKGR